MTDTLPAFPTIDSAGWEPPLRTDPVVLIRATGFRLKMRADADNADYRDYVWDVPTPAGTPRLDKWWADGAPRAPAFVIRYCWQPVPFSLTRLSPGETLKKSFRYTNGLAPSDKAALCRQLGIAADNLGLGIANRTGHAVTLYDQQDTTDEFTAAGPASGTKVWLLWDLIVQFIVAGEAGLLPTGPYRGDVDFTDDAHYSGAYLNYEWNRMDVSSGVIRAQEQTFLSNMA